MIWVSLATELSISDLELRFGCSWKPSLRDSVMLFSHSFQSAPYVLYLLLLMYIVCWAKLVSILLWHVDVRSIFFVWHLILLMFLVKTRSIMLKGSRADLRSLYQFWRCLIWGHKFKKGWQRKTNILYKNKKLPSVTLFSRLNIKSTHSCSK